MNTLFDPRQVRRAFSRASDSYAAAAALQHAIEAQLLESLDYLDGREPQVVLDLGSGPGTAARTMQSRWPRAQVIALDVALPMLQHARVPRDWRHPLARRPAGVCADARALPLADGSVDLLFSNLCLQWIEDLPALFAGLRRVLRPGGLLLCSTFGQATLQELRDAFAHADAVPHVSPFASIAQFGDALMRAGFRDPVLDRDTIVRGYDDVPALMRELRAIGATNALSTRRRTLTGRVRFSAAATAYEAERRGDGTLPASWEVITAMAWSPEPGTPIRVGGVDEVHVPAAKIRIRQRP
jgi:malonyl-CoA O-methyltransferase